MTSSIRAVFVVFAVMSVGILVYLLNNKPLADSLALGPRATEVSVFKTDKAYHGFTLYPEESTAKVKLLDMQGQVKHEWPVDADRARLLPNCNLLVIHGTKWGAKREPWRSLRKQIREYDWEGNVVWSYKAEDVVHHDAHRLPDGSTVFLKRTIVPENWQLRIEDPVRRLQKLRSDSVINVAADGKVLWSWHAHENFDLNFAGMGGWTRSTQPNGAKFRMQDWTHINTVNLLPNNKWYLAGDERFRPGNILLQVRNWSTTFILDAKTGKEVWRYSGDFDGGVTGGHEAHMIPEGLPGAGNILLFDNGRITHKKHSIVLEISPASKKVEWHYRAPNFYSEAAGSAQRLPNGNTLISEDRRGRVFEVTKEGEIVWEYKGQHQSNRASRLSPDFCPKLKDLNGYVA